MREDIYNILRRRIIRGDYEQGEVIREVDLAKEFNVSRTPIREVFQNLQRDKLISLLPHRGAQVTFIEFDFFFQVVAVKTELELMAIRVAAKRINEKELEQLRAIEREASGLDMEENADKNFEKMLELDTEFHRTVRKAAKNSVLSDAVENLQAHVNRYYFYTRYTAAKTLNHFSVDFHSMIEALAKHDPQEAEETLRTHMGSYYQLIQKIYMDMS